MKDLKDTILEAKTAYLPKAKLLLDSRIDIANALQALWIAFYEEKNYELTEEDIQAGVTHFLERSMGYKDKWKDYVDKHRN